MILPWAVYQLVVITNILLDLGYTYSRHRLNNPPDITIAIINLVWISTWTTLSISYTIDLKGIYQYLNSLNHATSLTITEYQEGHTASSMYTR